MQLAWKLGVVALVALALTTLPGGGDALNVATALLGIVFLAAISFLGYRLYRQYHFDLDALEPNVRLALYGSIALAVLTIVGTSRLFDVGRAAGAVLVRDLLGLDAVPLVRLGRRSGPAGGRRRVIVAKGVICAPFFDHTRPLRSSVADL
jgi:hypothetical protein